LKKRFRNLSTKRILNLGCGDDTYGTDRIDVKETLTTTYVHDLEKGIPFPDETFDEVYEKNLLEHLRNVGFHFEEIHRVLKPNGKLVLITDNAACLKYYLGTHTGRYEKLHGGDRHFSLFTLQHLRNHLEQARFKVEKIGYCDTEHPSRYLDRLLRIIGLERLSHPRIRVEATK